MKIAILAGNFDPPHMGHKLAALNIKKLLNIDQIWFIPFYSDTTKSRLAMTKLLEDDTTKLSEVAIQKKLNNQPQDIMNNLSQTYPQYSFYWIICSDELSNFEQLYIDDTFIKTQKIIIYSINEAKSVVEKNLIDTLSLSAIPNNVFILNTETLPTIPITSHAIREKIKQNQPIRGLVPSVVEAYIREHHLYI